jgi:hypothetical protein
LKWYASSVTLTYSLKRSSRLNCFCISCLALLVVPIQWNDPRTWPWFLYIWLAFFLAGWLLPIWRWLQREQQKSWPTASGRIDSAHIGEPKRILGLTLPAQSNDKYAGVLAYSYSISGDVFHGEYVRNFASEEAAHEFFRGLAGQTISVQYNSNRPSRSVLLEDTVESLLRNRPPALNPRDWSDSLPPLLKPFLGLFALLSFVGLVLSIWVHVGALFDRQVAPDYFFWGLHIGIFVVFIPAVLVAQKRVGSTSRKDFWKAVTKGSPDGLRYLLNFFFAYALVNFAIFWFQSASMGKQVGSPPALTWRGFSGHWMLFYCAAFAILTSALRSSANRD